MKLLSAVGNDPICAKQPIVSPRPPSNSGANVPASRPGLTQDACCLSPLAAALAASGLDVARSRIEPAEGNTRLDFSLAFSSQRVSQLKAEGIYVTDRQEMQLSLSFAFERQLVVDGHTERRTYQVQLNLCASNVRMTSLEAFELKEDIGQLVRRLVDDIIETVCKENTRLSGVIINHEDLLELASRDRGRTLEALTTLIQLVINYTHTLKSMREGRAVQDVILTPQRQKTAGLKVHREAIRLTDFSLSVRELDRAESQPKTSTPQLPSGPHDQDASNTSHP